MRALAGAALALAVLLTAGVRPAIGQAERAGSSAGVYRWVDDGGTEYFATGLDRVPERYRSRAEPMPASPAPDPPVATAPAALVTRIPYVPGRPILVSARIGGTGPVTLILDTGADRTLLTPSAFQALGVGYQPAGVAQLTGIAGAAQAAVVWVASIEVDQARVGPLPIVLHDMGFASAQGLLGRDFLDRFRVTIDSDSGVVTLAPPSAPRE
jgi:hypothetical protein